MLGMLTVWSAEQCEKALAGREVRVGGSETEVSAEKKLKAWSGSEVSAQSGLKCMDCVVEDSWRMAFQSGFGEEMVSVALDLLKEKPLPERDFWALARRGSSARRVARMCRRGIGIELYFVVVEF